MICLRVGNHLDLYEPFITLNAPSFFHSPILKFFQTSDLRLPTSDFRFFPKIFSLFDLCQLSSLYY
jgi:hypothetical protein